MEREDLWKFCIMPVWEGKIPPSWVINPALKSCSIVGNKWRSKKPYSKRSWRHLALKPKTTFYTKLFFPSFLLFSFSFLSELSLLCRKTQAVTKGLPAMLETENTSGVLEFWPEERPSFVQTSNHSILTFWAIRVLLIYMTPALHLHNIV